MFRHLYLFSQQSHKSAPTAYLFRFRHCDQARPFYE